MPCGSARGTTSNELDADDLLAPDKIERQLAALREVDSRRILLSSPWAPFYYRTRHARFVRNSLWQDLSPVEWLLRKMGENLHMQNATWLVSRELAEAAGPWDTRLHYDQDGEYFCRVLLASEGTRFVPGTGIFYRVSGSNRMSYIGNSDKKKDSLLLSMKLHIQYLRSLEESERVRKACLTYLQNWYQHFLSGATGYCCGIAGARRGTSGSSGGAAVALEICLDETDLWMENCKMGAERASAVQGFMHQALRQSDVPAGSGSSSRPRRNSFRMMLLRYQLQ